MKFKESLNTAVFTTKFVLEERKTITFVSHDNDDGAWQFLSDDQWDDFESVARVISLQEIIELDQSLLDLVDLPLGYSASRANKNDDWKIFKD